MYNRSRVNQNKTPKDSQLAHEKTSVLNTSRCKPQNAIVIPIVPIQETFQIKKSIISNCYPFENVFIERNIAIDSSLESGKNNTCLFGTVIKKTYLKPLFNCENLIIVDGAAIPKYKNYVLIYFPEKQKTSIQIYSDNDEKESNFCQENTDFFIIGVITELRKYY